VHFDQQGWEDQAWVDRLQDLSNEMWQLRDPKGYASQTPAQREQQWLAALDAC
jgi:hypothetical protein